MLIITSFTFHVIIACQLLEIGIFLRKIISKARRSYTATKISQFFVVQPYTVILETPRPKGGKKF